MRNRNQNITFGAVDSNKGRQLELFSLSGTSFDGRYVLTGSSVVQTISSSFVISGSIQFASASGIQGDTSGLSASVGFVGEYIEATTVGVSSWSSGVAKNLTSASLTSGSWELLGESLWTGTITGSLTLFGFSNASASFNTNWNPYGYWEQPLVSTSNSNIRGQCLMRVLLTSSLTVFLVGQIVFTSGTPLVDGKIGATRIR